MAAPMPTATPVMQTTAVPDMLPVTGGSLAQENNSAIPWLAAIIAAGVFAGVALFRRRMT